MYIDRNNFSLKQFFPFHFIFISFFLTTSFLRLLLISLSLKLFVIFNFFFTIYIFFFFQLNMISTILFRLFKCIYLLCSILTHMNITTSCKCAGKTWKRHLKDVYCTLWILNERLMDFTVMITNWRCYMEYNVRVCGNLVTLDFLTRWYTSCGFF